MLKDPVPFLSQEGTRQFLVHSRSEQQRLGLEWGLLEGGNMGKLGDLPSGYVKIAIENDYL